MQVELNHHNKIFQELGVIFSVAKFLPHKSLMVLTKDVEDLFLGAHLIYEGRVGVSLYYSSSLDKERNKSLKLENIH